MSRPASAPASPPAPRPRHDSPEPCRSDGWTIARQLAFIRTLHFTGCVTRAAAAAGMSREGAYRLRARPSQHAFAGAWGLALATRAAEAHTPTSEAHTLNSKGHTPASEGHTGTAKSHGSAHPPRAHFSGKGHKDDRHARLAPPHQFHQLVRPARS